MEKYVIPPIFNLDFKFPAFLVLTLMLNLRLSISADRMDSQQRNVTFSAGSWSAAAGAAGQPAGRSYWPRVDMNAAGSAERDKFKPFPFVLRTCASDGQLAEALRLLNLNLS